MLRCQDFEDSGGGTKGKIWGNVRNIWKIRYLLRSIKGTGMNWIGHLLKGEESW